MVMTRFKFIDVGASGAGETLVDALAGLGEKARTIKSITYTSEMVTGSVAAKNFPRIRAYKNQEQIVDFSIGSFNTATYSGVFWTDDIYPLLIDLDLAKGDGFQIGLFQVSGTPIGDLQIEYVDKE